MNKVIKSKVFRAFMCLALVVTMMIGTSATAFAQISGTETWYGPSDVSAPFVVTNNNMSPNKTMGYSGNLYVWFRFAQADPYVPEKVTMIVYNRTKGTSASVIAHAHDAQTGCNIGMTVSKGDVIQVFFDVSTEDGYSAPGPYRKAQITYGYSNTYGTW